MKWMIFARRFCVGAFKAQSPISEAGTACKGCALGFCKLTTLKTQDFDYNMSVYKEILKHVDADVVGTATNVKKTIRTDSGRLLQDARKRYAQK